MNFREEDKLYTKDTTAVFILSPMYPSFRGFTVSSRTEWPGFKVGVGVGGDTPIDSLVTVVSQTMPLKTVQSTAKAA